MELAVPGLAPAAEQELGQEPVPVLGLAQEPEPELVLGLVPVEVVASQRQ